MMSFPRRTSRMHPRLAILARAALDDVSTDDLQEHLTACVTCRGTIMELRRIADAARQHPPADAPADMLSDIHRRIADGERVTLPMAGSKVAAPAWRRRLPISLSAAAGILMAVSLWAGQSASPASASELPFSLRAMSGVLARMASLRDAIVPPPAEHARRPDAAAPAAPVGESPAPGAATMVPTVDADSTDLLIARVDSIACGTTMRSDVATTAARSLIAAHAPERSQASDPRLLVFVLEPDGSLRSRAEGPPIPDDSMYVKGRYGIVDGHVTARRTGTNMVWQRGSTSSATRGYCLSSLESGRFRWPVGLQVLGPPLPADASGISLYELVAFEAGTVAPAATQVVIIRL